MDKTYIYISHLLFISLAEKNIHMMQELLRNIHDKTHINLIH